MTQSESANIPIVIGILGLADVDAALTAEMHPASVHFFEQLHNEFAQSSLLLVSADDLENTSVANAAEKAGWQLSCKQVENLSDHTSVIVHFDGSPGGQQQAILSMEDLLAQQSFTSDKAIRRSILHDVEPVIYHIYADADDGAICAAYSEQSPESALFAKQQGAIYDQLAQINIVNQKLSTLTSTEQKLSYPVLDDSAWSEIGSEESDGLKAVHDQFSLADAHAIKMQQLSDRTFKFSAALSFFVGVAFLVHAKLLPHVYSLVLYTGLMVLGFLVVYGIRFKNWYSKHIHTRGLAEFLRIGLYWQLLGQNSQEKLYVLNKHCASKTAWIAAAARHCFSRLKVESQPLTPERADLLQRIWVQDQRNYFANRLTRIVRFKRFMTIASLASVSLSILCGGILLFEHFWGQQYSLTLPSNIKNVILFSSGVLTLWAATLEAYHGKMASDELQNNYENMLAIYQRSANLLASKRIPLASKQHVFNALAEEALLENIEWLNIKIVKQSHKSKSGMPQLVSG